VGANVGVVSYRLAVAAPPGIRVHAFEPHPRAVATLRSLFQDHGRVHVHACALGDSSGELSMALVAGDSSTSSAAGHVKGAIVNVPMLTGDDVVGRGLAPGPRVIKIDVEGFEPRVVEGLKQTIASFHPCIFFEHIFLDDAQVQGMCPTGYELRFIDRNGQLVTDARTRGGGGDAVMIPRDRLSTLEQD
jgi:FkbM family methyltransferase